MKTRVPIGLLALLFVSLAARMQGADFDFYERLTSLVDTNRFGPDLTNTTLSLAKLKQNGEIAGVKLGSSMSAAVQKWGKPRSFISSCGGGPVLSFGHGALGFRGDKVVRMSISPNTIPGLCFENGLTPTNTPAQFARTLGVPAPDPEHWLLTLESDTTTMELQWMHFATGGRQLGFLNLELHEPRQANSR